MATYLEMGDGKNAPEQEPLRRRKDKSERRMRIHRVYERSVQKAERERAVSDKKLAGQQVPKDIRSLVFDRDHYTCRYCGEPLWEEIPTIDHIVPKSRGGPDLPYNLATACEGCNLEKADRLPNEAGMDLLPIPAQPETEDDPREDRVDEYTREKTPGADSPGGEAAN